MITEHWLVFLVLLVLLLNDTSMFSGKNYWTADFVLVGVSLPERAVSLPHDLLRDFKQGLSTLQSAGSNFSLRGAAPQVDLALDGVTVANDLVRGAPGAVRCDQGAH